MRKIRSTTLRREMLGPNPIAWLTAFFVSVILWALLILTCLTISIYF